MDETQNDGYLSLKKNDVILNRYQVQKQIGKGTFGTVYACTDLNSEQLVAIKILRAKTKYFQAGQCELSCLNSISVRQQQQAKQKQQLDQSRGLASGTEQDELLGELQLEDSSQLPQLLGAFNIQAQNNSGKHLCLIFPLYGPSLLQLLKANDYRGFNVDWTREMSRAFLKGVAALHSLGGIHTDIKVENIVSRKQSAKTQVRDRVFVHPPGADLLLIDLGSAIFPKPSAPPGVNTQRPELVCTRQYRAPEVTLGLPYSEKLDIWSCGCVIYEILTGKTLFMTHDAAVHLFLIQKILGPPPRTLMAVALTRAQSHGVAGLKGQERSPAEILDFYNQKLNQFSLPSNASPSELRSVQIAKKLEEELPNAPYNLLHLLRWMLAWDEGLRPTAQQVLQHPFFVSPCHEAKGVQVGAPETTLMTKWSSAIQAVVDGRISLGDFRSWWLNDAK